jgi:hypothetical protein
MLIVIEVYACLGIHHENRTGIYWRIAFHTKHDTPVPAEPEANGIGIVHRLAIEGKNDIGILFENQVRLHFQFYAFLGIDTPVQGIMGKKGIYRAEIISSFQFLARCNRR